MDLTAEQVMHWVSALLWPFMRISALLLAAPIFGSGNLSVQWRLILALLLALVVAPQLPVPAIDPLSITALEVATEQILIGLAMGFIVQMVFSAVTQAGESVALSMGLGFSSVVDPTSGVQVPIVSQMLVILATLLFLALNGHLLLLAVLVRSFHAVPIGAGGLGTEDLWALLQFGTLMFGGALAIALPAVAALLMVNVAVGVIARAAPQLNIFAVGFPAMMLAGFVLLVLLLPAFAVRFEELLRAGLEAVRNLVKV